jgi:hypothetical protein
MVWKIIIYVEQLSRSSKDQNDRIEAKINNFDRKVDK